MGKDFSFLKETIKNSITSYVLVGLFGFIVLLLPIQPALATSAIANAVTAFCAPDPTMPDVGSCSACHSTTNNRGLNDLTAAGSQALAGNYAFFCPNATATPTPTPTTPTTPPPGSPGSAPGSSGMGMGAGATDDDDEDEEDDEPEEVDD